MALVILELALVDIAVGVGDAALSLAPATHERALVDIAVGLGELAAPVDLAVLPGAGIDQSVGHLQGALAVTRAARTSPS